MTKKTVSKMKTKSLTKQFRRQAKTVTALKKRVEELESRHTKEDERARQRGVYQIGGGPYLG